MHMKTKILITGGTGLVGWHLSEKLEELGYQVLHLSRTENLEARFPAYQWDIDHGQIDPRALEADHIIHLAGENVAGGRWTASRKQRIYDSRIKSTRLLADYINDGQTKAKSFVSASAIGIYGNHDDGAWVTEATSPAEDFLATVVRDWEAEADEIKNIPVGKVRIGVVLSEKDGALPKIMTPVKLGVGAPLGEGRQYMSWIHIDDLIRIFVHVLHHELAGAFNATAPSPETNEVFTRLLAEILKKPLWLPNVPSIAMKALLGEMSQVVLGGARVSSRKLEGTGFVFHYPELKPAIKNLLS